MPVRQMTSRRLLGYLAVGLASALAAVTLGDGVAAASPRSPFASDTASPATPFDPSALLNALNDYFGLLSTLAGGNGAMPGVNGGTGSVVAPQNPSLAVPGLP